MWALDAWRFLGLISKTTEGWGSEKGCGGLTLPREAPGPQLAKQRTRQPSNHKEPDSANKMHGREADPSPASG